LQEKVGNIVLFVAYFAFYKLFRSFGFYTKETDFGIILVTTVLNHCIIFAW